MKKHETQMLVLFGGTCITRWACKRCRKAGQYPTEDPFLFCPYCGSKVVAPKAEEQKAGEQESRKQKGGNTVEQKSRKPQNSEYAVFSSIMTCEKEWNAVQENMRSEQRPLGNFTKQHG